MKRLKNKLLSMEPNTATYKEMYEGEMTVIFSYDPDIPPSIEYEPIYFNNGIGFLISLTHKLAQDKPTVTIQIPIDMLGITVTSDTAADFCLRAFRPYIDELNKNLYNRSRPDNENGKYYLYTPGETVVKRNSAFFAMCQQKDYEYGSGSVVYSIQDSSRDFPPKMCLCIMLQVQLPKKKLRKAIQMLCRDLPDTAYKFAAEFDICKLSETLALAEKQEHIRRWLKSSDYCAFIANGSILPRSKGTELPLPDAVPFMSAKEDEIEICGIRGMGIKKGVTVITGGGYSGKSTLLNAISAGIYNHTECGSFMNAAVYPLCLSSGEAENIYQ